MRPSSSFRAGRAIGLSGSLDRVEHVDALPGEGDQAWWCRLSSARAVLNWQDPRGLSASHDDDGSLCGVVTSDGCRPAEPVSSVAAGHLLACPGSSKHRYPERIAKMLRDEVTHQADRGGLLPGRPIQQPLHPVRCRARQRARPASTRSRGGRSASSPSTYCPAAVAARGRPAGAAAPRPRPPAAVAQQLVPVRVRQLGGLYHQRRGHLVSIQLIRNHG